MTTLYEELEIATTATAKEIKAAYRKRSMTTHPDREGGSEEVFKKVKFAYEVLSDPMRREAYDTGRNYKNQPGLREKAIPEFQALFAQVIQQIDIKYGNVIKVMRSSIENKIRELGRAEGNINKQIERNKELASRISVKEGENLFVGMLEANNKQLQDQLNHLMDALLLFGFMISMLDDYEYEAEQMPQTMNNPWNNTIFTTGTTSL